MEGVTPQLTLNSKEGVGKGPDYNETINMLVINLLPFNSEFFLHYVFYHSEQTSFKHAMQ